MLLSFIFALVVGSLINGYSQSSTPGSSSADSEESELGTVGLAPIPDTSDASFTADVMESEQLVLVDFGAEWCVPCKKMLPIIQTLASEYSDKVKVVQLDVDANPKITAKYKVKEIPTFVFFSGGGAVETIVGTTTKKRLAEAITHLVH